MRAPSSWPNHLSKAYLLIPPPCGTFQHMNEGGEKYTKDHSTFQIFAWHVQRDMFKIRRIFLHIFYIFFLHIFYIFFSQARPPKLPQETVWCWRDAKCNSWQRRSNAWKWKVKVKSLSHVRPFATPWTATYQAPLSMGFSRQEYWSGLPLPSPLHHRCFSKSDSQVWTQI